MRSERWVTSRCDTMSSDVDASPALLNAALPHTHASSCCCLAFLFSHSYSPSSASYSGFQTHVLQDDAADRIASKPDIVAAAAKGNISLVCDHVTVDGRRVHEKDARYDTVPLFHRFCFCFSFLSFADSMISPSGNTALILSADKGHLEVCKLLISAKSDLNACNQKYALPAPPKLLF